MVRRAPSAVQWWLQWQLCSRGVNDFFTMYHLLKAPTTSHHFSMINNAGEPFPNIVKIRWQLYYVESQHAAQHFVNTTILWG